MTMQTQEEFQDRPATPFPAETGPEVRKVLNRPDLSNQTVHQALEQACQERDLPLSEILGSAARTEDRNQLIRALAVPPPRHGLDMPEHDLNPPLATRLAPMKRLWLRTLLSARPLMRRNPAPARSR